MLDDNDNDKSKDDIGLGNPGNPVNSTKAVIGLICALATCCLPGIMMIPALILSILALMEISAEPGKFKGMWMAVTGMVFGVVGSVLGAIAWYFCFVSVVLGGVLAIVGLNVGQQAANQKNITSNNLKQITLARSDYFNANQTFPTPSTPNGLSWRVTVLPYVDQKPLFDKFDQQAAWDAAANKPLLNNRPNFFESRMHPNLDSTLTPFQTTVGPNGLFKTKDTVVRLGDIKDGTSNTLFVIDTTGHVPWTQPVDLLIDNAQPLPATLPTGRFLVGMLDGSVRMIDRTKVTDQTLRLLIDPNDGQALPQNVFE